ncbi:GLPGLI family protein [Mesonia maritima]|uniref:GLPGLI family protein n=1 Tax=Mesonia maritima TaxID=1793873 RepID=A0ABU1K7L7_9FLAO|nr:GLPGLI family protein [Mesonia maritima]MDR6300538.1 GLPGLI family protein [Mesonia maritima]
MHHSKILLFFGLFFITFCNAQQDTIRGIIEYKAYVSIYLVETNTSSKFNKVSVSKYGNEVEKKTSEISKNPYHLYFNSYESLYNLGSKLPENISEKAMNMQKGVHKSSGFSANATDKYGRLFYRNFKTKEVYFKMPKAITDAYVVKDNWLEINWKIYEEHKEILGYKVQKAEGYFRGRKYIVWFTKEISYPYGPWKLFGLPGVILESYDSKLNKGLIAERICYPCEKNNFKQEIKKPEEKIIRTIKEHVYLMDHGSLAIGKKMSDTFKEIGSKGDFVILKNDTLSLSDIKKLRNFSPEVQYEWESFPGDTPVPNEFKKTDFLKNSLNEVELNNTEK